MKVSLLFVFAPLLPEPPLECKLPMGRARWTFYLKLPPLPFQKFPGLTPEALTINLSGSAATHAGAGHTGCRLWFCLAVQLQR